MGTSQMLGEDIDSWETMMFLYNSALKEVGTKLEILNDEFVHIHKYNPIEYIKSRIKTPESIVKKLKRDGYESTIENMRNYINDIAGIRIVCSFTSDIYRLAEMIGKQNDLTVICVKDYIKNPKPNGYRSYHIIVEIPVFFSKGKTPMRAEIQRWKSRSAPLQWISGQVWSTRFIINLRGMPRNISAGICVPVQKLFQTSMQRCCS